MQNMADSWGKARKEVTCSICSGLFIEPKIFPCLHTFCKKCLQGAWKESVSSTDRIQGEPVQGAWKESDSGTEDACKQSFPTSWLSKMFSEEFSSSMKSTSDQEAITSVHRAGGKTYAKREKEKKNSSAYMSISKVIECPLCLGKFTMTSASIETLPTNTGARQLVELVTMCEQLNKKTPPSCQLCECNSKAISSCLQCNVFLCTACEFSHKRLKLTSTHQINCLKDIKSGKVDLNSILDHKQELCSVHPDKYLELFCKNENCGFICLGCAVVKHRDHQYDFISQVVEEQQQQIKSTFPSIEMNIEQLEQARAKVQVMQEGIQNKRKENIKKIEQTFSKINTALMEQKQRLLDEVNRISEQRINSLSAQQKQLDTLCQQMKNFLDTTKEVVTSGRNQTVLDMKNPIMDRNKSLMAEKNQTKLEPSQSVPPGVKFHTLDSIIALVNQMGTIPCAERCSAHKKAYKDYSEFKLTLEDPTGNPISGCAALINVFSSTKSVSCCYEDITEDALSIPLQVYDVGNGEYSCFNMYSPYCNHCCKPMNYQHGDLQLDIRYHKRRSSQAYVQPFSTSSYVYCNHCGGNRIPAWNQYVSVFVNKEQISDSPFK